MGVALFVIASRQFPAQVGGFIGRITSIWGVKAKPAPGAVTQEVKGPEQTEELLKDFDNQLLLVQENIIRDSYLKNVNDPATRERVLVRHFASACIVFAFESTYNSIWGSQLQALRALNESGANGLPEADVKVWYDVAMQLFAARYANYPFHGWLNFLHGNSLVQIGANHQIYITQLGNEFLVYLVRSRYTMNKDG
jgi:hypothetical protein